jgi:hypothetical protein
MMMSKGTLMKKTLIAAAGAMLLSLSTTPVAGAHLFNQGPCVNRNGPVDVQACNACVAQHGGYGPGGGLPGGAMTECYGSGQPMQFPQCDKYNGDLMSHQICVDNVARGLPPDNIRR